MYRIIYASRRKPEFKLTDITAMLIKARGRNSNMGISGFLVFGKDQFLQVIEGFEPVVKALKKKIYEDPRHYDTRTIMEGKVDNLLFTKWNMAYFSPSDLPDYFNENDFNPLAMDELDAAALLHQFRRLSQEDMISSTNNPG